MKRAGYSENANMYLGASQVPLVVKNPLANAGDIRDTGSILGPEDSPGGGHGNSYQYSCWRIAWTEELGRLQSMGSQRVGHDRSDLAHTQAVPFKGVN